MMRLTIGALTCLCLILSVSAVPAKEKKHDKHMDQQAMMELWKKMAVPGEPHKLFASLAGSWTTTTKEWMEPGKPPTESSGTAEMKMLLDGRFLYQEYNGKMTHRAVWKIVDSNTQTFDMYGAHKGDKETKMLEIVYSRKQ